MTQAQLNQRLRYLHAILASMLLGFCLYAIIDFSSWIKLLGNTIHNPEGKADSTHVIDHLNLYVVYGAAGVALLISVVSPRRLRTNHVLATLVLVGNGIWHIVTLLALVYPPNAWHWLYDACTIWAIPLILLATWRWLPPRVAY